MNNIFDDSVCLLKNPKLLNEKTGEDWVVWNPLNGARLSLPPVSMEILESFAHPNTIGGVFSTSDFSRRMATPLLNAFIGNGFLLQADRLPLSLLHPRIGLLGTPLIDPQKFISLQADSVDFTFLGLCYERGGTGEKGTHFAPRFLRQNSIRLPWRINAATEKLCGIYDTSSGKHICHNVGIWDLGDINSQPCATQGLRKDEFFKSITATVRQIIRKQAIPIVIGGDHSLSYPVISAFDGVKDIGVIHFDAHIDLESQSVDTTRIELCSHGNFVHFISAIPNIKLILQVGQREIRERPPWQTDKIKRIPMSRRLKKNNGILLEYLPDDLSYYITLDVDVLDPLHFPNTGTPVPGGLTIHELHDFLTHICSHRSILGMDIMELIPSQRNPQTGMAISNIIFQCIADILDAKPKQQESRTVCHPEKS